MADNLSGHITKSYKSPSPSEYGLLFNDSKQLDIFIFISNGTCFAIFYIKQLSHKLGLRAIANRILMQEATKCRSKQNNFRNGK